MTSRTPENRTFSRRHLLGGGVLLALAAGAVPALGAPIFGEDEGLMPNGAGDQSDLLQAAFDKAAESGRPLALPAGRFAARNLRLSAGLTVQGVRGRTILTGLGTDPIASADGANGLSLSGLTFDGQSQGPDGATSGLLIVNNSAHIAISDCAFANGTGNGLSLHASSGRVANSHFSGFGLTALYSHNATGMILAGNRVLDCGNGGIRVFRSDKGFDGTIVTGNQISNIRSGSGNGQNGNGINVYLAGNVVVADNVITDCDFSAVRLNSTDDCQVTDNNCSRCREVAIFSEFAFSGSIVMGNLIDDAAQGISITNLDDGGRLAVCANNLVRNINLSSPTNPDTRPVGIFAEANCAITGNTVDNVPGIGILAGWGPYLKDVLIANNVVSNVRFGIGASVAEKAGAAHIAGNMIANASDRAITGFAWSDLQGDDLSQNPDQFANVTVSGNRVS